MAHKNLSREQKLLHYIDPTTGIGLEIGPSYNPVLPKSKGYKVMTVDHCTREELIEKYQEDPDVDLNMIEEVDYVWNSGSLHDLVSKDKYFDFAVASHLIEHIPNPIGWLQDISLMLKDDGYLSLAVPDKDFCFDFSRPVTTTGQWLQAYSEKRDRHSQATIYDSASYCVRMNNQTYSWGQMDDGKLSFIAEVDKLYNGYLKSCEKNEYIDFHFSVFTPLSFQLLICELNYFGLIDFVIEKKFPPKGCEFIVILRKSSDRISHDKVLKAREEYLQSLPMYYPGTVAAFINFQILLFRTLRRIARSIKRRLMVK